MMCVVSTGRMTGGGGGASFPLLVSSPSLNDLKSYPFQTLTGIIQLLVSGVGGLLLAIVAESGF